MAIHIACLYIFYLHLGIIAEISYGARFFRPQYFRSAYLNRCRRLYGKPTGNSQIIVCVLCNNHRSENTAAVADTRSNLYPLLSLNAARDKFSFRKQNRECTHKIHIQFECYSVYLLHLISDLISKVSRNIPFVQFFKLRKLKKYK